MSQPLVTLDETVPDHPRLVVEVLPEQQPAIQQALGRLEEAGDGTAIQRILSDALLTAGEQLYFWTPEWQARERAVDTAIAEGKVRSFDTMEEMIEFLDGQ